MFEIDTKIVILAAVFPILASICASEVQRLTISNVAILGLVGLFAFDVFWANTQLSVLTQLLISAATGVVMMMLWAMGRAGAGDVKLATVIALFVPPNQLGLMIILVIGFSALTLLGLHIFRQTSLAPNWESTKNQGVLPFGIPLALSLLTVLVLSLF